MNGISEFVRFCETFHGSKITYAEGEPLSAHTTFRIGGPAAVMVFPASEAQVGGVLKYCAGAKMPLSVLGKGSNVLAADEGYDGVVLLLGGDFARVTVNGNELFAEAGAPMTSVCKFAAAQGLSGLEFAYGIPGTVGGGAVMNAGAYGGEFAQVVKSVRYADENGAVGVFEAAQLDYGYRHSVFTGKKLTVTGVTFALHPAVSADIEAAMNELLRRRVEKQPLEFPSAGSTFLRPEGHFAGALIEAAGLKGRRVGGAEVSVKHAGFVVNAGGATCADVLALIEVIRAEVRRTSGVELACEIKLLK